MAVSIETSLTPPRGEQQVSSANFTKFFVIKLTLSNFNSISPFFIQKTIQSQIGEVASVQKLRSGDLLIQVCNAAQASTLSKTTNFGAYAVKVSPHASLNSSKGVISESDLFCVPETEILENLKEKGVVNVRRITVRREGKLLPTKHIILTFNSPSLPTHIHAGYLRCSVRPYIPNPLRCFKCQRFGHTKESCRGSQTCARCAQVGHESESCSLPAKCINCKSDHPAYSRSCTKWTLEKEIQTLKITQSISFVEARRIVYSRTPTVGVSYASVVAPKKVVSVGTQTDFKHSPKKTSTNSSITQSIPSISTPSQSVPLKSAVSPSVSSKSKASRPISPESTQSKSNASQSVSPHFIHSKSNIPKPVSHNKSKSKPTLSTQAIPTSTNSPLIPVVKTKKSKKITERPINPRVTPGISRKKKDFRHLLKDPNKLRETEEDMLEMFTSDLSDNENDVEFQEIPPPPDQGQSLSTASFPP